MDSVNKHFPQPVRGAEALVLGANVVFDALPEAQVEAQATLLQTHQTAVIRQDFRWSEIEPVKGQFNWARSDAIFAQANRHSLRVLAVLLTSPAWARPPSGTNPLSQTETTAPQYVEDFARFARAFANRYDSTAASATQQQQSPIVGYQIWDEPNLSIGWGNNLIDPAGYLRLLWASGDAIRAMNPYARIVLAGLAPTVEMSEVNLAPSAFLRQLYRLGGHDAFDVVATKPYGFNFPALDRRVDPAILNFSNILLLREEMVAHGEQDKAIWATEFGWNALPSGWRGEPSIWGEVSETQQAAWTREAVIRAAREWPWLGALFIDTLTPRPRQPQPDIDPAWGFGMLTQSGETRPVFEAFVSAQQDAQHATRGQLAAVCDLPTRLVKVIDNLNLQPQNKRAALDTLPDIETCYVPNPQATYSEGWRFGRMGADVPQRAGAKVNVRFSGDAFALTLRRAGIEYRAYAFVTIDGQPANLLPREPRGAYIVMNSADLQPHVETIEVANGLGPGEHVAEITIVGGWNLWALVGWSSRYEFQIESARLKVASGAALIGAVLGLVGLVFATPRAGWRVMLVALRPRIVPKINAAHAVGAGLLMWLTASLTWAQDASTAWRNWPIAPALITGLTSALAFWSPVYVIGLIALVALFGLVLLRLDLGVMLLAFFIPFYLIPQRLFAHSFSMVELLTLMCLVSWCVSRRALGEERGAWSDTIRGFASYLTPHALRSTLHALDWSVLLLAVTAILSSFQAAFQVEAFRELRMVILESAAVYLVLRTSGQTLGERGRWRILDGLVAGVVVVALIGLFNYVQGDRFATESGLSRIKSVFGSANNDALLFERVLPLLVAMFLWRVGRRQRAEGREQTTANENLRSAFYSLLSPSALRSTLYAAALVPVTLALVLTQSRGALLFGVPASLFVVGWLLGGRWRRLALVGLGLLVILLLALFTGLATPLVEGTRLANAFDMQNGTGFFRLNLWSSAWRMWLDHFWLGVGPDNFLYAYRSFYILPVAWKEPNLSHPHNLLFEFATRLGLPGLIAGIGLIAGLAIQIRQGLKHDSPARPIYIGAAGMLAAMLAHGMVDQSFFLIELAFPFMVLAGIASSAE